MSSWTATLRFLILVYILEESGSTRWPAGSGYGLPRAKSGCPHADGFEWLIGRRYQDTENTASSNERSNELHLDAQVNRGGISRGFCMKTSKSSDNRRSSWPPGKYCIYKKGETCPLKLLPGDVKWDDENKNNQNKKTGTLPDGVYDADTVIEYCCSTSGDVNVPISLPTLKPFFLLAYGSPQCQQVNWAVTSNEWIRFDTEDRGNSDHERGAYPYGAGIKDHNITYCYYQDCRNKLIKESGTFRSPNYPRNYPNGQLCSWNIMVNSTQRIRLIFTDFVLQEDRGTDSVTVYDGVDETGKMLGVFFGGNLPSEEGIISSSNTLFVMFRSDKNGSFKGFSASYIAVRIEECGTSLTSETGIFHSPNFPRRYPNGQLCSWNIIVSSTQRIHLIFTHFDLQEDKDTDSVTVYDGINETGKMLGMFHGGKLPSEEGIVSSSNTLSVIFQTDKSGSGTGFKASYSAVRIVGKSSSIVETSYWPQTSHLLRPEPTSSSMSVVKTADLGTSSTEYRETTSPATVYHSPSNWLVTTISSTAESDTVTPMLALFTTTGKDKTSLHPSNTMLIKKSTSTDMRLESTDYKLSGQITPSYKTESQQTTAIPEILSPECGTSLLTWERGILHSPNFPRHYPNGQLCSWNIIVKSTQRIHLIFTHFDLQEDKDTDSVIVYDGIDETGKILGVFYGGKLPSEEGIVSSSNTLSVIFQTDKSGSGRGFRATYSAVRIVGTSSSIVETSSWPQTSILLLPEPTSSMSVVKTSDLGITSAEYRETTSPATVYHSPSNWLVTTPSSIAESDIVKPMLVPSNTTDKDKTSLYLLNTMPIEKSISTKMKSEATDYKFSRRITTSHKTEPQQTRTIPDILSSGMETIMAPSTTIGKDKTPLHPSNTMLIKKSTSTDMRLESTDYKLSGQITSSYKTESQQTTAIPEILSPGIRDTSPVLLLNTELVHSPLSLLSSKLTAAGRSMGTSFDPRVPVTEMLSYSKMTKSLKLSSSPAHERSTRADLTTPSSHMTETVFINLNATPPFTRSKSTGFEKFQSPRVIGMKTKLPVSTAIYSSSVSPSALNIFASRSQVSQLSPHFSATYFHELSDLEMTLLPQNKISFSKEELLSSATAMVKLASSATFSAVSVSLGTEEVTSPIVRVLSITQTSLTATRTSKPVVTATVSSSSLISRHFTSRNQDMKHPTSQMHPITSSLPETRLTFSTEGKLWTSTLLLSTSIDKELESLSKSLKTREGVTLSYTKAETTPFYKKMTLSTETPMLKVTLASKAAISTSQAQGIVSLPKSMEGDAGMTSWYTNTKMTTFFTDMTSKLTESKPAFSRTLAWEMKARSASRISNLDLATSHTKGDLTSFDFEVRSSVAGKSMETSLIEREISATPSMKVSKTAQVFTSTVQHLSSDKSLSTLSSSMSSSSSSTSAPSTSLLSSSSSSTTSPPSLSSSLSSILSSSLSLSSSPSWSSLFSPSSSSLLSNSSLLAPRLSTAVAKQSKSASTPPTSTSVQRISQLQYSSSSSSLMSSRSVLTQTFPGQRSEATKQSKAASTLGVISSVQQSREIKSSPSLSSSSSSALSSFTSSSPSSSLPSTIHPSSSSSNSPSFTSSSSSPLSSATSSLASSSASSSSPSSSPTSSPSSSPTSSLASSSSSSSSPSTLHPLSSPISRSTSSSVTSSFSLTSSSSSTLSASSLSSSLAPLPSSTSTSSLSSLSSSASSSSLQLTSSVLSSSLSSSSSSSFSTSSWSPLSSSTSLKSSPPFSSPSPSVSSSSLPLSSSWRSLPRSSLLSVEQGTMPSNKGTKKTTHLTKSTHLSMTPLKYSSNGEQAVRKTSTVETSSSQTEQPTSSDPEKTSPTTDKTATNSSPTRNVVARKAERGGGGLNIILIVVPVVVLFLLIILIVAVLTCYQRRKAKYKLEEKT
ncbi:serine-rich adhesin for platelets-like isoform X2 [Acropora muricata]|uniref:serine-rich adhesin for platelets-like isoform X2 n=1 Tax=Acropora muricata TaxID=159855 RepID=UPI0034E38C06